MVPLQYRAKAGVMDVLFRNRGDLAGDAPSTSGSREPGKAAYFVDSFLISGELPTLPSRPFFHTKHAETCPDEPESTGAPLWSYLDFHSVVTHQCHPKLASAVSEDGTQE